ncbi:MULTISPECIES: substrate-binding domain-containing protein [unclassified Polaromonas]|uniref:molybdate ABC transporter substrate-binding protein n=1 Tax=unclassified Polaromonas TaxID=2638319 RepID=UPI000F08844A|nr:MULTISPECIES: substrate-binding domain-containing protein [unclassified Polaromonas]AYQ27310.1 ABC transporter substrate-binding protein [Polaromonas sp. SP1]QGJ17848.1 ABC transporter substrate-binding protein [Polaromonas sp. Pch-P]
MTTVHLLSGGAAQGLVTRLEARLQQQHRADIDACFGAVGLMRDKLLSGAPCDLVILTEALVTELTAGAELVRGSARALGVVKTGVAVKSGAPAPAVDSPDALKAALRAASGIYSPDPVKATAGIHVMGVLRQLGLDAELAGRLRVYPNGASAMKAMADSGEDGLIGCTQVTEILYTPGVTLVAPLPKAFELATVYTAAVCARAREPQAAQALIELLASGDAAPLRKACGFE